MTTIYSKYGGEQEPTSYADVVEGLQAYFGLAADEGLEPSVRVTECFTGGFSITTGTFNNVEGVDGQPGSCDELVMYVLPEVAYRLLSLGGVAQYCGRYDTFDDACLALEANAQPHDPEEFVLAYDSYHPALSFDEASAIIAEERACAEEYGGKPSILLAPTDTGYEIVAFMDVEPGIINDSEYVSDSVAQRLVDAGLAEYMEMA